MWRLTLLVIAFVEAAASINESSVHKVFRITPKNEEQLEFLRNFDDSEDSGVSVISLDFVQNMYIENFHILL